MKIKKPIELKKLSKDDAVVEKLTAALGGKAKVEWSRQFAASGKLKQAPPVRR